MNINLIKKSYLLSVILFVLLSIPHIGYTQIITLSNDCSNAELKPLIYTNRQQIEFSVRFDDDYSSISEDGFVPMMNDYPDAVFTGIEGWIKINSGEFDHIFANSALYLGASSKNFNVFDACDGTKLILTTISDADGDIKEVYQLTPNTDYLIQVLVVESSSINFPFTADEQVNNRMFFSAFNEGDHPTCESALDISNLSTFPQFRNSDVGGDFPGKYYVKYTATANGSLHIDNARTSDIHDTCFETTDFPNDNTVYHQVEAGSTYYLMLRMAHYTNSGPVTVTFYPAPINVNCDDATNLSIGAESVNIVNGHYPTTLEPRLSQTTLYTKSYYSFIMPTSGGVNIISNRHNRVYENCNSDEILNYRSTRSGIEINSPLFYGVAGQEYIIESIGYAWGNTHIRIEELSSNPHPNQLCSTAMSILPTGQVQEIDWSQTRGSVWYKIENTTSGILSIQKNFTSSTNALRYTFYIGNCEQRIETDEGILYNYKTKILPVLPPNEFHYLEITFPNGDLSLERPFTLNFAPTTISPPPNDVCNGALLYENFGILLPSSNGATIPETNTPTCAALNSQYTPNVWYTFECPESGIVQIPWNATLYEGDCNSLNLVHCTKGRTTENTSLLSSNYRRVRLTPGEMYFVSTPGSSLIITDLSSIDSECENPTAINFITNTKLSIFSEVANIYNTNAPTTCYSDLIANKDVWYSFTTPEDVSNVEFSSPRNLGVSLYTGDCTSLTEIGCGEVNDETNFTEVLLPSTSYLLRISGHYTETLQAQMNTIPNDQDICTTAPTISVSSEPFLIERYLPFSSDVIFDCADENIADRWMKFLAPSPGVVVVENTFSSVTEEDYFVELFSDCASVVQGTCSSEAVIVYDNLTPSMEYFLHISSASDDEANSIIYTPPVATANGSCASATTLPTYNCSNEITGYSYNMSTGAWYTGTMPSQGALKLSFSSLSNGAVYVSNCNDLVLHKSFEAGEDVIIEGIPGGAPFFIQVNENQRYSFCLETSEGNQNPNFYCHDAIALNTNLSLECTTTNEIQLQRPNGNNNQRAYWYKFIATSVRMKVSGNVNSALNASIIKTQVYDICDGTLLGQAAELSDIDISDLVIGNEYLIKVTASLDIAQITSTCSTSSIDDCYDIQVEQTFADINLCISELLNPAINDKCITATTLPFTSGEVTVIDSTHRATDASYDCLPNARELWYTFTSSNDMNIIVKTTDATIPLNISSYKSSCGTTRQACAVDSLIITIDEGETYFFSVSIASASDNTNYTLSIAELVYENSEENVGVDIEEPVVKLQVDGGVAVGNSVIPFPGNIRYNGSQIQGFTTNGWKSLSNINPDDLDQARDNMGNHSASMNLKMNNNQIEDVPLPLSPKQASNKEYVDLKIQQLSDELSSDTLESEEPYISNIFLETTYDDAGYSSDKLNIETSSGTFSMNVDKLSNGWVNYANPENQIFSLWNNDANVGIGYEEPLVPLHINGVTRFQSTGNRVWDISTDGPDLNLDGYSTDQSQFSPHFKLIAFGTSTPAFDFDLSSKRLGIGVENPQKELDVNGEVQISTNSSGTAFQLNLIENNSGYARLNFTNTSNKDITLAAIPSATPADSKLNFFIEDAGDVMTLTGAQRVGINNNNPQSDLHIKHKDGPLNGGLRLENVDATSTNYWNMYISSSSDELRLYANNTKVGGFDFTSGAYTSVSDERMKSSIQPLHFEWSKFMLLNAANYSFLHDANKRQYLGLLAQEVQEIYPELVRYDEEEDTYRLDYSGTGVIAIKAVQELKKENEVLKKENEAIKKILLDLQKQINAINEKK